MLQPEIKKTFRSAFTGQEIDEILTSIRFKIDSTSISNEFETPGNAVNEKKIASAELANILNKKITDFSNPEFLKEILEQIDDFNIYTDADKQKLTDLNTQFKGTYGTVASRNVALSDPTKLINGDLTLILDDGTGLQAFQYWDISTQKWVTAKLIRLGDTASVTVDAPAIINFTGIDIQKYKTVKFIMTVNSGNDIHTKEVLMTYSYLNGGEVYCVTHSDMVSGVPLFNVGSAIAGVTLNLVIETLVDNCTISAKKVCEF